MKKINFKMLLVLIGVFIASINQVWGETVLFYKDGANMTNAYAYFYSSTYWDNNNGAGSNGITSQCNHMTSLGGSGTSKIYVYQISSDHTMVAIMKDSQSSYGNFNNTCGCANTYDNCPNGYYSITSPMLISNGSSSFTKQDGRVTYYNFTWGTPTLWLKHPFTGTNDWYWHEMTYNNDGTFYLNDYHKDGCGANYGQNDSEAGYISSFTKTPSGNWSHNAQYVISFSGGTVNLAVTERFTIDFDLQGHGSGIEDKYANHGTTISAPSAPSEAGWTFGGWYTDEGCTSAYNFSSPVTSDITLYAKWTEKTYSVTIATNNSSMGTLQIDNTSQSFGSAYTIGVTNKITVTPNDGYYFTGWSNMPSGMHKVTDNTNTSGGDAYFYADETGKTITANFAPQYVLRGSIYSSDDAQGMPGWGSNDFGFVYANSEWSVSTSSLTKSTKYKFKLYDRKNSQYLGINAETNYPDNTLVNKAFSSGNSQHGIFTSTFAGSYKFVLDKANMKVKIVYNSKAIPNYSSKSVTQALNSAASGYVVGAGTSASHYKVYQTMASAHGKVDLTMNYSGVSTAHDAIYYSVAGAETGTMSEAASVATATMSMNTSTGSYSPAIKAYAKVDDQYNMSYAAALSGDLYYDVVATPSLGIALKTTSDVAITSTAGLELGTSFKIVPTLSGAIRSGSYITYSYRVSGSSDEWTTIASSQATGSAYTWSANLPTEPNIYTIKATYNDLGVTVTATEDIVIWKDYTIYVWETGQDLNTADQNITRVHEYYKANSNNDGEPDRSEGAWKVGDGGLKQTTDLSSTWGGGWHSFDLKWPLYNYFIVGYEAYNNNQYQSNYYYLASKPENLYLHCTYSGSAKWTWGASAIEEPQKPTITITDVNVYATKMVVTVAINNHYSLLTAHSITVNNESQDSKRTGTVTNVGGGTYTYTLTGLEENTEYTFRASATNGLGTTNEPKTIMTLAKMPFTMTIKVSSNLMANTPGYWGANGKTTVKIKYWNDDAGFSGIAELERIRVYDGYAWYKYTIEDGPANFYIFNANYSDGTGANRSANWNNQRTNGCAEVYDATGEYSNHTIGSPAMCGVHYKLAYYNGRTTIESNVIGDESDKMSLFIGAYNSGSPAGRSLKLYKFDAGWDSGTEIFSTVAPEDSAVYVVSLKENVDFESANTAADWTFEKYTGDYYIRTDHAPGGRNNFRGASNKMTYSDYAAKVSGSTFDHYFCKWVEGGSDDKRNVSFTIANDYNDNLLGGSNYYVSDDYATASGYLKQNASVRFMYDSRKNDLSRAYLSGSSAESDLFLVLKGNASNHLYTKADKSATHSTNGTADWAFFSDNNNWIYQVDVFAVPGTRIKLTAQMTDNGGSAKTQSFLGDDTNASYDPAYTHQLIGGTGSTAYEMRVIYDFKINRLMTAWIPTELGADLAIDADVMLVREGQAAADQITLNNHTLSDVYTIYSVMQFNRWTLNNRANPNDKLVEHCARNTGGNNWVYDETVTNTNHPVLASSDPLWLPESARNIYWISFPFDVQLNEVFGSVGTYGVHWGIEHYDGKERAKKGYWADSEGFWKLYPSASGVTLNAYEGYLLVLDLDYFLYNNTTTWANNIHQVELFFPSESSSAKQISVHTEKDTIRFADQSDYQCKIDRRTDEQKENNVFNINKDRRVVDSYWHCIGVPSFHNVTNTITQDEDPMQTDPEGSGAITYPEAGSYWEPGEKLYLYEWSPASNSYTVNKSGGASFSFQSMWAYMVQYSEDELHWVNVSKAMPNSVVARKAVNREDYDLQLELLRGGVKEDHTLMSLTDDEGITNAFEFNHDLSKEMNGGKGNIWTVTTDGIPVAGNSMPYSETTTVVPVGVKIAKAGNHTFSIPEGTNGVGVVLVDKVANTRTNLGLTDYTVNLEAGQIDGRFELEISPVANTATGIDSVTGDGLQVTGANKRLVDGMLYIVKDGVVYDARGSRVQ